MTGNGNPAPPKSTVSSNAITQTSGADTDVLKQNKPFATEIGRTAPLKSRFADL
jgi:hypothetical protein